MTDVADAAKVRRKFYPNTFLSTIEGGRTITTFTRNQRVYPQGDLADAVFYIQKGKVRLSVVSESGKEATIGVLNEGDFFGEGCLTGQPLRMCSATAMMDCSVMRIDKKSMMEVIHREHGFSDMFVAYLLTRNIRYEEDLVDQLFNSSEKRLARVLLMLAHFGKDERTKVAIPKISQEALAEMVGTTRGRINLFMNRFRKLGFIDYHGSDDLQIHSSLLNIVLHD
jgi:CRP/FNR family transcriptional regulator, cyclic AMP receptor protein